MKQATCHDCGAMEGQIHEYGCDMERCPFCGHQLISCDCVYRMLSIEDRKAYGPETGYIPQDIYENGLTTEQHEQWMELLNNKGRLPYIVWPNLCARCGTLWPDFFRVPDEEWKKYVEPQERRNVLCLKCWNEIKRLIDSRGEVTTP